ncbi:phosphotransferase [Rubrobacter tropicus]|uniref:Phosphotransferase n=1 Tax=Rubrobacter tropicus TaxID=2653851 RepID=A0A6G8Q680_9ACTN|nr:aminoglycoside phosphotransferase family protein [Rubrobacter tropicus]QIN81827.1 phosphotransferase [Rubrobacter tropicus]
MAGRTGGSVDEAKTMAERSLAEKLMNPPVSALSRDGKTVRSYRAGVIKTSMSRPILRYTVTGFDRERGAPFRAVIIGKGYYRYDGAETFGFMNRLWSEGFAEPDRLTIPEPIAYLPEMRLLLQSQAEGKALYDYIDNPGEARGAVRLTARWLAKLHATGVTDAPVLPPDFEESKLRAYKEMLMQICPPHARRVEDFTEHIISSLKALDPRRVVPTHGDFQPKNVYVLRDRVTVIDFDRFALAHPARDLGHFVGQSMTMSCARAGSFEAIGPWNAAFLEEYARLAPPGALAAMPVFVARTFMEVLKHKIFLDPAKNARLLPAWLDECERWLGKAHDSPEAERGESRLSRRESEA